MSRRDFVACAVATGLGGVTPSQAQAQDNGGGGPSPGLQLFTIHGLMQDDVPAALALVAAAGYRHVEFADYFGYPASELRLMLDDTGLMAPSMQISQAGMTGNPDAAIESALGHRYIDLPSLNRESRASLDADRRAAGQVPYNVLLDETDPAQPCCIGAAAQSGVIAERPGRSQRASRSMNASTDTASRRAWSVARFHSRSQSRG